MGLSVEHAPMIANGTKDPLLSILQLRKGQIVVASVLQLWPTGAFGALRRSNPRNVETIASDGVESLALASSGLRGGGRAFGDIVLSFHSLEFMH